MSDYFEKAVLLQFDQSPTTPVALKREAAIYIDNLKNQSEAWKHFVERFNTTSYMEVKFWCLQTITETLPRRHSFLSLDEKQKVREVLIGWILDPQVHHQPVLLRNKLAQTVTAIIRVKISIASANPLFPNCCSFVQLEYPKLWPSFFSDLILGLDQGEGVADMFCRIFLAIDSDIISQDIHRSVQEQKISVQLKDAMRESCIKDVVNAWYHLVLTYRATSPELTVLILNALQKYIGWMSVGLVVNNRFMPLLFDLLKMQQDILQEAAIDCLTEILLKGMEPSEKIHFIQKMGIVQCCAAWKNDGLPGDEGDELREKCAKLLATLCSEILECCKRVENSCIGLRACKLDIKSSVKTEANQICKNCESMMDELFPSVLRVASTSEDAVSLSVVPFLNAFVLRLKHFQDRANSLPEKELNMLRRILQGVLLAARYPSPSEIPPGEYISAGQQAAADEELENVANKRNELFTILKNIVRIDAELVCSMLIGELQNTLQNGQAPYQDVEILLSSVFELGEACTSLMQQPGCGPLAALVLPFIQLEVPNAHHQVVSLALLELYCRFYRVLLQTQQDLPRVLSSFVGERGILHPAQIVSDRGCYLFMRFVKSCRGAMKPFAMHLLRSLAPFFSKTLTTSRIHPSPEQSAPDPRLYVFEAAGLLLGSEELDPTEQNEALVSMVSPALNQMEALLKDGVADHKQEMLLVQSLESVSRISKGFKHEQVVNERPELGHVFVKCLEICLKIPNYTKSRVVDSRVVSFLHRMVELLEQLTLPYLNQAFDVNHTRVIFSQTCLCFQALMQRESDIGQMIELVTLLHQLVTNLQESLTPFLKLALPILFQQIWLCLGKDWDWSGNQQALSKNANKSSNAQTVIMDETRDRSSLQRLYYGLIYAVFTQTNGLFFLEIPSAALQTMLMTIEKGARTHVDIATRRICVQVLRQLAAQWHDKIQADWNLMQFVMRKIGFEICILQIFDASSLDSRDAATNALFQDIANCLKSIFSVCGNDFIKLLSEMLINDQYPPGFGLELIKTIQTADVKKLKDFYKQAVSSLTNR